VRFHELETAVKEMRARLDHRPGAEPEWWAADRLPAALPSDELNQLAARAKSFR